MKLLILIPGKQPRSIDQIGCFTDVLSYYLPRSLSNLVDVTTITIPNVDNDELKNLFATLDVKDYNAIITLGLRFYSKISLETANLLRSRFAGLFCQVHDGSRLDYDPVDITFTFKDDTERMSVNEGWFARHQKYNEYMGWAADPELNVPNQCTNNLRILVDHTNYGGNNVDKTQEILHSIKHFVESNQWRSRFKSVSVRRFDSGCVVDVDFNNIDSIKEYDRTAIPISEISKEHSAAHIFCVTHPESVGLVVLETAMAGALTVSPKDFIPADRLATVRHLEWENTIDWQTVLDQIDVDASRNQALTNTWDNAAKNIINVLKKRTTINIVCLKWGTKFGVEYVNRLYASVTRNISKSLLNTTKIKFHCFTDNANGIRSEIITHPLPNNGLETWWNKLYLFSKQINIPPGEKIVFVDLDTVITNNIDSILMHDCKTITALKDFYIGIAKSADEGTVGSALMSWYHGDYSFIWDKFIQNPSKAIKSVYPHGDQHWITACIDKCVHWQDILPNQVVSFKVHCASGLPDAASIICYHGKPSIPESVKESTHVATAFKKWTVNPAPWILDYWKE